MNLSRACLEEFACIAENISLPDLAACRQSSASFALMSSLIKTTSLSDCKASMFPSSKDLQSTPICLWLISDLFLS